MDLTILLALPVGWMISFVFGMLYAAPTILAIADAYGRPSHEWPNQDRRGHWILALCVAYPLAITMFPQVVAAIYAVRVPRRVSSPAAVTGARAARGRAFGGFMTGIVIFGPLMVFAAPSDSNDMAMAALGMSIVLVALSMTTLLYSPRAGTKERRIRIVLLLALAAAAGGFVVRAAAINACAHGSGPQGRWCRRPEWNSAWIPPVFAAGGAGAAAWVTRPHAAPTSG